MPARISVIVVTYNHEPFLAEALDGVLAQSAINDAEIIISEDGSSDGTRAIVERYAQRHPDRITAIFSPHNLYSMRVLNRAIEAARGDYIAYLDGDDVWTDPHKLARQMELLDANPQMAMCYHNADLVDRAGAPLGRTHIIPGKPVADLFDLIRTNPIPACSAFYRAPAIKPLPEWMDRAPCGDWMLHLIAAQTGEVGYIDEVMGVYRQHPDGMWSGLPREQRFEVIADRYAFLGEVMPEYGQAIEAAAAYWAAAARIHHRDLAGAIEAIQAAAAIDPQVDAYLSIFAVLLETPEEARALTEIISMAAPMRADYFGWLAESLAYRDFADECRMALRGAIHACEAQGEGADQQLGRQLRDVARYLRERGHTEDADEALRNAVLLLPGSAKLRMQLANRLVERKQIDEAIAHLREAIALDGRDIRYAMRLAGILHRQKQFEDEVRPLRRRHRLAAPLP